MSPAADNLSSVILFFVDGLGIGEKGDHNPLSTTENIGPLGHFPDDSPKLPFEGVLKSTDPRMGIEGRPQSASGQTTILTGVNAPSLLGRHKQGFPNAELRELIRESSIFKQLAERGLDGVFANTYTPPFFESQPRWKSATTVAVEAAGGRFRRLPDLLGRESLYHDFTNRSLIEKGYDVPEFTPEEAGRILASLSARHRFVLYEHFITDKIGHDRDMARARSHLPELASFLRSALAHVDLSRHTFILTSDHGNIENLAVRTHTLNDVPTVIWGRRSREAASAISDLSDITPVILDLLDQ